MIYLYHDISRYIATTKKRQKKVIWWYIWYFFFVWDVSCSIFLSVVRIQRCLLRWHLDAYNLQVLLHPPQRTVWFCSRDHQKIVAFILDAYIYLILYQLSICIYIYQTFYHVGSILDLLSFLLGFHPFLYVCRLHPHLFSEPLLSERAEPKNVGKSVGQYCWEVTCRMVIKHGGLGYRHTFMFICSYMFILCFQNVLHCVHMHARYSTSNIQN
jgi:hypothetical protein